ncbi:sugar phosphate nucleotidyltransferase [Candidatus Pelagibacter sp. HIMB1483]|uniref:sugar phosphate nucleotidyltransferase n=1 Tax=Candidatus Pelagibacter sp. HIMB1483 TaxID=3415414 RepID=UPI003F8264FA
MKIKTALILCAGYGKRLNPITLSTPKPLLKVNNVTMLENCINMILSLGIKKIILNTFHLSEQIKNFLNDKKFSADIRIVEDGTEILNTGGGILNMISNSQDDDYLVFNPDTLWKENYINEINQLQNFYYSNQLSNILLVTNKNLSYDKNLKGDFQLKDNLLSKNLNKDFIYIGCQILNKNLFKKYKVYNFSISEVWNELLNKKQLNGFESFNKFYHLTNLEIFKKLKDF